MTNETSTNYLKPDLHNLTHTTRLSDARLAELGIHGAFRGLIRGASGAFSEPALGAQVAHACRTSAVRPDLPLGFSTTNGIYQPVSGRSPRKYGRVTACPFTLQPDPTPLPTFGIEGYRS
ncbi:MAG TPA: hypothetical protein PK205_17690, partial [Promineifilum sp.]|nr:hypothetical protein [Rhodocyclaceae bacterium]HRQ15136.1 hypothetical protein [Promineifilum sp.]